MKEIECVQHIYTYELRETNSFTLKKLMNGTLEMIPHYLENQKIAYKAYNRLENGREMLKQMVCQKLGVDVRDFHKYYKIVSENHRTNIVLCAVESDKDFRELYTVEELDNTDRIYTIEDL